MIWVRPTPRQNCYSTDAMDQPPQLDWLFPVPLFQQQLPDFSAHQPRVIDFLQNLKNRDDGVRRSNVGGWHSTDLQSYAGEREIDWLLTQLRRFALACVGQLGSPERRFDVAFDAVWAIINRTGDWNTPHNHMPSQWSGVCYFQVDERGSETDQYFHQTKKRGRVPLSQLSHAYGRAAS